MTLFSWLRKRTSTRSTRRHGLQNRPTAPRFRPRLEALEDRWLPSTLTVTNNLDSGAGSLRADIAAAHSGGTINFAPSLDGKAITLTSGELFITTGVTIQGPGASQLTVSGRFEVNSSQPVVLSGLTISNGHAVGGGGIANDTGSGLTISGCTISHNWSNSGGGGIFNRGTLTVTGCTIAGNTAYNFGAGIYNYYRGTLTVSNSTIAGNTTTAVGDGGGIYAGINSTVTMTNCTISNNRANYYNYNSVIYGDGGGVYADSGSTVTLTNCTLANNVAGHNGGGLYVNSPSNYHRATVKLTNCTVSGNSDVGYGGGIYLNYPWSILTLFNTIVAGNTTWSHYGNDIYGNVSGAFNTLVGDAGGSGGIPILHYGNIVGGDGNPVINALLGPLQNNGGPTQTMALLAGSLAIGHGNNSLAPAMDQRGFLRLDVAGETTDIGAFEL